MRRVYVVLVEVGPMKETLLPPHWTSAYVNVYVSAANLRDAIDVAEGYLLDDKYAPLGAVSAEELEIDGYEERANIDEEPDQATIESIQRSGGYAYGVFHGHSERDVESH